MSFVKKGAPPPDVEEGDVVKAQILLIEQVTSQWKDKEGNPKEQLEFNLQCENGYKFKSWMAYYVEPTDRSRLGRLAIEFEKAQKKKCTNVQEFLTALKQFGYVFVKCTGFREYEEELYPNFSILSDKIPAPTQEPETPKTSGPAPSTQMPLTPRNEPSMTRGEALEKSKNWPAEDRETWLNYLQSQGKLKD